MKIQRREFLQAVAGVGLLGGAGNAPVALATSAPQGDWRQVGRTSRHAGHAPNDSAPTSNVGAKWSFETDYWVTASPAVTAETVYVGSRDETVYALDRADGTEQWSVGVDGDVVAAPAVAGGTVLVGTRNGTLYALDAETGTERWRHSVGQIIESSPAVVDGTVYVGSSDGAVYALSEGYSSTDAGFEWTSPMVAVGATGLVAGTGYAVKRLLTRDTPTGQ